MRFLLVDDEKSALMSLKFRFSRYGIEAATFDEEEAAFSAFEANPAVFDAVVAKLAMRRIRGDTFAQRVWGIEPEIPITILSGLSAEERLDDGGIEPGVCIVTSPAPISDILSSLASQGLRLPLKEIQSGFPQPSHGSSASRFRGA